MDGDFAQTWSRYVLRQLEEHRGDLTNEQIGKLVDASGSMVGNWLKAEGFTKPSADKVVNFWRRFGEGSTLPDAMAAAGYGRKEEYDTVVRHEPDLGMVETERLLEEVLDRTEPSSLKVATRKTTGRLARFRARQDAPPI